MKFPGPTMLGQSLYALRVMDWEITRQYVPVIYVSAGCSDQLSNHTFETLVYEPERSSQVYIRPRHLMLKPLRPGTVDHFLANPLIFTYLSGLADWFEMDCAGFKSLLQEVDGSEFCHCDGDFVTLVRTIRSLETFATSILDSKFSIQMLANLDIMLSPRDFEIHLSRSC